MDKSSTSKFLLGVGAVVVLKVVFTVIWQLIKVLANAIVYFGLYVPFFYFILGSVFVGLGAFSFGVVSINMILFYVGLTLCFGVSVCIFVRSYGKKPVRTVVAGSAAAIRSAAARPNARKKKTRVIADTAEESAVASRPLLIYYSQQNPTHLVHEYEDHFDVYLDDKVHPISFLFRREKPKDMTGV
ncbi:MAG: hypothetical protein II896_01695 [Clostridia bacterium]|nr:hypothetical protein [Clostridia bacterium]